MSRPDNKKRRKRILFFTALIAVIFISWELINFNTSVKEAEKSKSRDFITEWTEQNASLVRYKADKYYDILDYAAKFISKMPLDDEETRDLLYENFSEKATEFEYFRIIGKDGFAAETGRDYSDTEYFQTSMAGGRGLAKCSSSYDNGVLLSVPVKGGDGETEGVLCGVLFGSRLSVFKQSGRSVKYTSMFITDGNGDCIVGRNTDAAFGSNIFADLEMRELSVPLSTIEFRARTGVTVPFEINSDYGNKMAVISPVKGYDLYVVTIIDKDYVLKTGRTYQRYVLFLTIKILLALAVFAGGYLHFQRQDRVYIRNLNRQLTLNEETYRITAKDSDLCVFTYDVETELIQFLNDKYLELGLDQAQLSIPVLLKKIRDINPATCSVIEEILQSVDSSETSQSRKVKIRAGGKLRYLQFNTTNLYDESGKVSRMVGSIEDITSLENNMLKLQKEAMTDLLTGAMNRAAGTAMINQLLENAPDEGCVHTFTIADLDNFKTLNDVLGHMWGDKALYEVVLTMQKHCRAKDVVCRLGGDEFVVFMPNMPRQDAEESLQRLSAKLHINYEKDEKSVMISASMGIVTTERAGATFQELYEEADKCLYQVKRTFKGSYHIAEKSI
ncbi:MAG: diguanylate cyclase [Blautia sp.]|uniref:diguanylate cyclase n=1 Tax=Blautia sp. TaxID=1955243 RepID=UPI0025C4DA99|nr:diguanylate cyclase [Blautia sp.]MCI7450078.1 diguanylate cyclase [Blautia sp.]